MRLHETIPINKDNAEKPALANSGSHLQLEPNIARRTFNRPHRNRITPRPKSHLRRKLWQLISSPVPYIFPYRK